jgi:hypothetical protein
MSPIPLGILAASGVSAFFSSYDLLQTEILTGSQASVTISSLGDYAANYQHLQVRLVTRSTRADTNSRFVMQFNGDSGSNYNNHWLRGTGSAVQSEYNSSFNYGFMMQAGLPAATGTSNAFGANVIDILDPFETSKYTTVRNLGGMAQSLNRIALESGAWRNTDSITSITFDDDFGSFAQYSRFSLYGLKASV